MQLVYMYFILKNKSKVITNFLEFFQFFPLKIYPPGSGSMRIRIHSPETLYIMYIIVTYTIRVPTLYIIRYRRFRITWHILSIKKMKSLYLGLELVRVVDFFSSVKLL